MKLRFHENSLRLRLSRPEIARLKESGRVENTVTFAPGQTLAYSIESALVPEISAKFEAGRIRVMIPQASAVQWVDSEEVSLEGTAETLTLLIEKDFQCLHRASDEDRDGFPNPLA